MNIINCILLVLLLLISMALLKYTDFPLVINFLNFVQLLHLQVLLIVILPTSFVILIHPQYLMTTLTNLFRKSLVSYDVNSPFINIPLQETIDVAINFIFNHKPNLKINKKELKKLFLFATSQTHFIFNSNYITKLIKYPWVLLWLLSLLIFSCVFTNPSGLMNIILTNLTFI